MRGDNTLLYIVVAIVILHFLIGIGYLVYKLAGPIKKPIREEEENNDL